MIYLKLRQAGELVNHKRIESIDPKHNNRNFADALRIFDILFGTYHRPRKDEFAATGLGAEFPAPRSIWSAQLGPVWAVMKTCAGSEILAQPITTFCSLRALTQRASRPYRGEGAER